MRAIPAIDRVTGLLAVVIVLIIHAATVASARDPQASGAPPAATAETAKAAAPPALTPDDLKALEDAFKLERDAASDAQLVDLMRQRSELATSRANVALLAMKYRILSVHGLSADVWDVAQVYLDEKGAVVPQTDARPGALPPEGAVRSEWRITKKPPAPVTPAPAATP